MRMGQGLVRTWVIEKVVFALQGFPVGELEIITIVAFAEYRKPSSISSTLAVRTQTTLRRMSFRRSTFVIDDHYNNLTIHLNHFHRAKPFSDSFPTRNSDQD